VLRTDLVESVAGMCCGRWKMNAVRAACWLAPSVLLSAGLILGLEAGTRTDIGPALAHHQRWRSRL